MRLRHHWGKKVSRLTALSSAISRLYIPRVVNRTTGLSMGEHTETTAKKWGIRREDQDRLALQGHERAVAAWDRGFFDDLVIPIGELRRRQHPAGQYLFGKVGASVAGL